MSNSSKASAAYFFVCLMWLHIETPLGFEQLFRQYKHLEVDTLCSWNLHLAFLSKHQSLDNGNINWCSKSVSCSLSGAVVSEQYSTQCTIADDCLFLWTRVKLRLFSVAINWFESLFKKENKKFSDCSILHENPHRFVFFTPHSKRNIFGVWTRHFEDVIVSFGKHRSIFYTISGHFLD